MEVSILPTGWSCEAMWKRDQWGTAKIYTYFFSRVVCLLTTSVLHSQMI